MTSVLFDKRGNIAVITALILPALLAFAGAGIDFSRWAKEKNSVQQLADTLALRGAKEMLLVNFNESQIESVVAAAFENGIAQSYGLSSDIKFEIIIDTDSNEVTVNLKMSPANAMILTQFEPYKSGVNVSSTAVARGGYKVCAIALSKRADVAFEARNESIMEAEECSILSNSTSPTGITLTGRATISASVICSSGGTRGSLNGFIPKATLDCPQYDDPLVDRMPPSSNGCDHHDVLVGTRSREVFREALRESLEELSSRRSGKGRRRSRGESYDSADPSKLIVPSNKTRFDLEPGVYCGGLTVASNAVAALAPGTYIIKDGPLTVDLGAFLVGEGVSFYFVGDDAAFSFAPDSKILLEAEKTGAMAGILFFEDREAPQGRVHRIASDDAQILLGTIYLPRGTLRVSTLRSVADQSAYTVIVANKIQMSGSPTLVLNSDYASSDVPVPDGVGPIGGSVLLRQ